MSRSNSKLKALVVSVAAVGYALWLYAGIRLLASPGRSVGSYQEWLLLAGAALVVGPYDAVKLERLNMRFRLGDAFIVIIALLYGVLPAVFAAALVSSVVAFREDKRLFSLLLMPSASVVAIFIAGTSTLKFVSLGVQYPVALLGVLALIYYFVYSTLMSVGYAVSNERPFTKCLHETCQYACLSFFFTCLGSLAVYGVLKNVGFYAFVIIVPILFVAYFTYKTYLDKVEASNQHVTKLAELYLSTIESLTMAIDAKDQITHGHVRRVQVYAMELADELGFHDSEMEGLKAAALLHDIGKLAIPEYILNKPGRLTAAEFNKMSQHPTVAAELLKNVEFPYPVIPLVLHHHEKWNGSGYPAGLKGEDIPVGARILSIVDCYDALRSNRPYRHGFSMDKTLGIMANESGTSFDPELLQVFFTVVHRAEEKVKLLDVPHEIASDSVDDGEDFEAPVGKLTLINSGQQSVYRDIAAAHKEVLSLYDMSQTFSSTLNLSEILSLIASKLSQLVNFNTCVVYLADPDEGILKATHIIGEGNNLLAGHTIRYGDGISGWVATNREPIAGAHPQGDFAGMYHDELSKYTNSLVFPLLEEGEVLGVLSLYATADICYADDQVRLMELVAKNAATALRNARRFEETQESALTDQLTGLPNSRYMHLFIEQELNKASVHGYPVTLLMMDLDGFKRVNDQFGHHVGDELLRDLAKVLNGQIRRDDILVRYGGDEFVAVLIGTTMEQTEDVLNRMQNAVEEYSLMVRGKSVSVGISIGQSVFPDSGRTLEELMVIADANMYRNKDEHRGLNSTLEQMRATS